MEKYKPEFLYKYLSPERMDVLQNKQIRYSQLHDLNDPFDSNPYFHNDLIRLAGHQAVSDHQYQQISSLGYDKGSANFNEAWAGLAEHDGITGRLSHVARWANSRKQANYNESKRLSLGRNWGVLCLSERGDNQLMWSHYASNHEGFVIKFKPGQRGLPFRGKRRSPIGYLSKVDYLDERPIIEDGDKDIDKMLLIKNYEWKYENEWRIVRKLSQAEKQIKRKKQASICLFKLPAECIESIIVGCRASKEFLFELMRILQTTKGYEHVSISGYVMDGWDYSLEETFLFGSVNYWKDIHRELGYDKGQYLLKKKVVELSRLS